MATEPGGVSADLAALRKALALDADSLAALDRVEQALADEQEVSRYQSELRIESMHEETAWKRRALRAEAALVEAQRVEPGKQGLEARSDRERLTRAHEALRDLVADWTAGGHQRPRLESCGDTSCGYAACRLADAFADLDRSVIESATEKTVEPGRQEIGGDPGGSPVAKDGALIGQYVCPLEGDGCEQVVEVRVLALPTDSPLCPAHHVKMLLAGFVTPSLPGAAKPTLEQALREISHASLSQDGAQWMSERALAALAATAETGERSGTDFGGARAGRRSAGGS